MELIIEHAGRGSHRNAADMQKVSGDTITIGRAFDNDIILTDPHVCPHHAIIESDTEGQAQLRDLNSVNGSYNASHTPLNKPHTISSGDAYIIGRSRIRIYFPDHPVEDSIKVNPVEKLAMYASAPVIAIVILLIAVMLNVFIDYASELQEFRLGRVIITNIGYILALSIWPICWSIFSRLRKHEAKFVAQVTVSVTIFIIGSMLILSIDWLKFHLGINNLGLTIFYWVISIGLLGLLIGLNYYLAGYQIGRKHMLYTAGLTLTVLSFTYALLSFDDYDFNYLPKYHTKIYPPSITIYSAKDIDTYLELIDQPFKHSAKLIEKEKEQ